jgi:hypothetical protein
MKKMKVRLVSEVSNQVLLNARITTWKKYCLSVKSTCYTKIMPQYKCTKKKALKYKLENLLLTMS